MVLLLLNLLTIKELRNIKPKSLGKSFIINIELIKAKFKITFLPIKATQFAPFRISNNSITTRRHSYSDTIKKTEHLHRHRDCILKPNIIALMTNLYYFNLRSGLLGLALLFTFSLNATPASGYKLTHEEDVPGPLPAGWTNANIGSASGSATYDPDVAGGLFSLTSNGYSPNPDLQHSAWRTLCGNVSITARVSGLTNPGWAGIEIRESAAAGSRKVSLKTQLSNITYRSVRSVTNGPAPFQQFPTPLNPSWLRITRTGNNFQFFVSTDGTTWQVIGMTSVALPNCVQIGLFAEGLNSLTTTTANFTNVSATGTSPLLVPSNPVVAAALPDFSVYPNPTSGELNIDLGAFGDRDVRLELFNAQGQLLQVQEVNAADHIEQWNLSAYEAGIYWIRLHGADLPATAKKVMLR